MSFKLFMKTPTWEEALDDGQSSPILHEEERDETLQMDRSTCPWGDLETREFCVSFLKEWTVSFTATIVFDSTVDEFTGDGLFNKVKGKENIAIIGTTTDGDVFGGFYSEAVTEQDQEFYDREIFAFSFESHGRCKTPQQFFVKDLRKKDVRVCFDSDDKNGFVDFWVEGVGGFVLGNEKSNSFCNSLFRIFDRLDDTALSGQLNGTWASGPFHHCSRLMAVQLG